MAFDSGIISFTTKTDKVDLVAAAHINAVQSELVIIETILGTGLKGTAASLSSRLNNALDSDGSLLSGSAFPSPGLPSQPFYRTDLDNFYIRNAANTNWNAFGNSLSNAIFSYVGVIDAAGASAGEIAGSTLTPTDAATGTYRFISGPNANAYSTVLTGKYVHLSGIVSINVKAWIWTRDNGQANVKVDIGGQNNNVSGTASQTTPEYKTVTVTVSSLTPGVEYDITISMKDISGNNHSNYLGKIQLIAS